MSRAETYRSAYRRGWAASARASEGALERADDRNEPPAWYDGYLDYAAGRDRYHLQTCQDRDLHLDCHPAVDAPPVAVRVIDPAHPDLPHAVCPGCGRTIMVRADGRSLYGHTRAPRQPCPMGRAVVTLVDAS